MQSADSLIGGGGSKATGGGFGAADSPSESSILSVSVASSQAVSPLEAFMQHVALHADGGKHSKHGKQGDEDGDDGSSTSGAAEGPMVHLSTIHAAKGLEWDVVLIAGVETNLLPHWRCVGGGTEEEVLWSGVARWLHAAKVVCLPLTSVHMGVGYSGAPVAVCRHDTRAETTVLVTSYAAHVVGQCKAVCCGCLAARQRCCCKLTHAVGLFPLLFS